MPEQLSLFETPDPSQDSLVLALFPDQAVARLINDLGNSLRRMHELRGKVRPITHLHVSLPLPRLALLPLEVKLGRVGDVCQAAAAGTRSFEINFNTAGSFRRRAGDRPLVLQGDTQGCEGIMKLHQSLRIEFAKSGVATSKTPKLTPHLTLLYDQREIVAEPVTPMSWTVREMVLVRSEVGLTKYHELGRWEFGGPE